MYRRPLLAGVPAAVTVALAGCTAVGDRVFSREPTTPSGTTVDTHAEVTDVLEDGLGYHQTEGDYVGGREDHYWTVVPDQETADERFDREGSIDDFLEATDFETAYLLVVQYGMQSDRELVFEELERTDDGIHAAFSIETPSVGGDDYAIHSSVLRITDEEREVPDTDDVTITIDGDAYPAPDT
ncbi:hypothetical protein [Natronobacterium texcoconense]|uniref:Uncharacterized protein n=1 Tax=Natronobacterium texcoconense TaxID=1095778 RepID=A0A1H0ZED7_NATTX|nr:hypothetical protein [Natronobacterium texcoconense]SDQ25679.1 hypothetical protein SAMN04489842_0246 [Natronobacterium texcoconense]